MSKLALGSALGGTGVAAVTAVAVATGALDLDRLFGRDVPPADVTQNAPEAQAKAPQVGFTLGDQPAAPAEPGVDLAALPQSDGAPRQTVPEALTIDGSDAQAADIATQSAPEPDVETDLPGAPSFDLVRADPGGSTLVAGMGAPGATVSVLVNGARLADTKIGADGRFVIFLDIDASERAQVLSLLQQQPDGEEMASNEEVILAPTPAPAPEPQPEPEQTADAEASDEGTTETVEVAAAPETAPAPETEQTAEAKTGAEAEQPAEPLQTAEAEQESAPEPEEPVETAKAPETTPEPQAPAVLISGPSGIEVMQSAPLAPGDVALDAISYDTAGEVLVSGRGELDSFIRIYLDNAPLTTSRIEEDGRWRVTLPEVDTGTYTLRVDQIDEAGDVTARVESPFLRESAETLAAAAESGPITAITVQPGHTLWAIARDRYGEGLDYVKVYKANADRIRNPDLIYPGQIFDLPQE
ncbi:LysM peptidoglycan-binding domain-containing protein [Pacificoceanicola onchidii]|uniref:LysM peptidoglycan-binding domain-containing protein n=1 Tax=Pacificoceanicola onchidii TaxID=2562685 RepID=UPI001455EE5F|nr:LysM peptidoglycan-binding domain-containing protein [Pacificoceanicola onchidii]